MVMSIKNVQQEVGRVYAIHYNKATAVHLCNCDAPQFLATGLACRFIMQVSDF